MLTYNYLVNGDNSATQLNGSVHHMDPLQLQLDVLHSYYCSLHAGTITSVP